jgi:cell division protein FtsI/penicillin-binding protein 2
MALSAGSRPALGSDLRRRSARTTHHAPRRPGYQRRVAWLLVGSLLVAGVIWSRLVYWQVVQHQRLTADALGQYSKVVELPAARGLIYDRNGQPLAINETVYSIVAAPNQVPVTQREHVAAALSAVTGRPVAAIESILASGSQFAYIARQQPKSAADRLRSENLAGVGLEPETRRSYLPGGTADSTLASNLLGFVNDAGAGQYGVEAFYQSQLAGRNGSMSTYQDLTGREIVVGGETRHDPVNGSDLQLTIDADIQHSAEQALAAGVALNKAESGSVIVMDPQTGAIVAWADYPTYNANSFSSTPVDRFIDPIASYLYEPGSTMKVVTLSGALENKAITPTATLNDPGHISVGGVTLYDWDRANRGTVTYTKVLESSLNVGAVTALNLEGPDAFYRNLVNFGFATPSRIDVAAESAVPLKAESDYRPSEMATMSFGQGIDVNMVQMLAAVNVAADGGRYVQPHVVDRVGGRPTTLSLTPPRQVLSPATAAQMNQMMKAVVQEGSGSMARIPGFQNDEAGKTGTSQIPVNGQYTQDVWSSYAGYMPASNPRFTMLVVVRKPHNANWIANDGYIVAAPIWRQIAQDIILDWHIAPTPGQ